MTEDPHDEPQCEPGPASSVNERKATTESGTAPVSGPLSQEATYDIEQIFALLRAQTGHDFSPYKQNSLRRRIARRMTAPQIGQLQEYARHLASASGEVEALFRELLVGATTFFRDAVAFKALDEQVVTRLVADKPDGAVIRVWVPGCSTGEEAYSIAILFREALDVRRKRCTVEIFGTDTDSTAIDVARSGVYPVSIAADVGPERLENHFEPLADGRLRVCDAIRDLLVFSEQDVAQKPPFARLDLISYRNMMLYMDVELRGRLIRLFHDALIPGGSLFLGTAETLGEAAHLFDVTDRQEKIYRRKFHADEDRPGSGNLRVLPGTGELPAGGLAASVRELAVGELPEGARLREDWATAALVDERGQLLHLHGLAGPFLQPAPGEVEPSILTLMPEGLRHELTTSLLEAVLAGKAVFRQNLQLQASPAFTLMDLTVRPVSASVHAAGYPRLFLVIFKWAPPARPPSKVAPFVHSKGASESSSARADYLFGLDAAKATDASNEGAGASNEELGSAHAALLRRRLVEVLWNPPDVGSPPERAGDSLPWNTRAASRPRTKKVETASLHVREVIPLDRRENGSGALQQLGRSGGPEGLSGAVRPIQESRQLSNNRRFAERSGDDPSSSRAKRWGPASTQGPHGDELAPSSHGEEAARGPLSPEVTRQVLDELTRHQIELELQNAELRRMQQQLLTSRGRYFDLYNHAPVGYFTLNQAGLIRNANLTAARLLGVPRSELVKQPLARFIVPADQDTYLRHREQVSATRTRQVCELRVLRHCGEPCWVRLEETTGKDAAGALVCRAVVSDITVRRRAEDTLRASEARHRILFEKSHDALMTLAPPDWAFTSGNSTTIAMFGARDEAEFLSHAPSEYSPPSQLDGSDSAEKAIVMIAAALRAGSHFYEWTFRRLSGQEFPATVLLTRIEIDGHPLLQATVRDETEVKRLQAMLRQADRLNSMGTLAAGVAHEINNPLTYVLYNIESLSLDLPRLANVVSRGLWAMRAALGEEEIKARIGPDAELLEPEALNDMSERARESLDGVERIRTISRAIGTFSRVESTERFRVDLNYAIECATTMALTVIKFRARLVTNLGKLPPIWASEGKLSQVFLNLLINAAHAIDEGDVLGNCIEIRTWAEDDHVFATIRDTGRGISEANIARIFEPFFTTKPAGVGSGLGLPICRNIVTEFGGDIGVESEPGKGTCFTVRLPVRQGISQSPPAMPAPAREVSNAHGRILMVDDEPAILSLLVHLLGADHELVTAGSGEAAQAILEGDQSFDVILCDLMMPGMSGVDLHAWVAAHHRALAQRIVFVTGGAFTPTALEYVSLVGNLRIDKPYDTALLKGLISDLVMATRSACALEGSE
jgi:PAS domain S-box-containing protein